MLDKQPCCKLVLHHNWRHQRNKITLARENAQHRHIIDLGIDNRTNPREIHGTVERGAKITSETGQKHGRGA